ncbi:MAG: M48 family metalloprotease [Eubacteriales bacterium]|nr:M48 family metalloprotease [Eubacteriales bacterium]
MKICKHCGMALDDQTMFCPRCGSASFREGVGHGYAGPSLPNDSYGSPNPEAMYIQQKLKALRHRAELPLFGVMIGISSLVLLFILFRSSSILDSSGYGGFFGANPALALFLTVVGMMTGVVGILYAVVSLIVSYYMLYAQTTSGAVQVTPVNFPEIYQKSVEYAQMLSLPYRPEVYIMQQNGVVNAFSAWMLKKRYVVLNAELVDIAYMENKDFSSVYFVMAHEYGHHYFNHTALWRNLLIMYAESFFPVSMAFSRACEYSCDRVAQLLTHQSGARAMMVLTAGRHLYKYVRTEDYLQNLLNRHRADEEVFRWIYNFFSSHPIMPYRVQALLDPSGKSGRIL